MITTRTCCAAAGKKIEVDYSYLFEIVLMTSFLTLRLRYYILLGIRGKPGLTQKQQDQACCCF